MVDHKHVIEMERVMPVRQTQKTEFVTIAMIVACYASLIIGVVVLPGVSMVLAFCVTTIAIALHSSLQHEVLHGHPTKNAALNELLVFPAVGLMIPYQRFRDLHIAHHHNEILTDPYDDPESNFLDPVVWAGLSGAKKTILRVNNTLLGRIILGPGISEITLIKEDFKTVKAGNLKVLWGWILHVVGGALVVWALVKYGAMPLWVYLIAAYFGFGLLKIRTYLEHRAYANADGRTVIIEDRGPLALLFLNNNYHVVHHTHPGAAWYTLRDMYFADPEKYLKLNDGYRYRNYLEVFLKYFFKAKDPVPHPLWKNI